MKKSILALSLVFASFASFAQWSIDKGHSKFTFIAEHQKATTTIKRSDFGIGGKLATVMVGDEISIRATGEFQKN
jgi:polyisoprenoid-binding protein YceI